ncbi:NAD(P)+ transhydrogenase beta chain [Rhizobium sp. 18055]|uniref:NAD(P)+ transhydrogenase beta chain n=1 Tax=Rhizobium sp. 18055 TaxID=2681403 RepID=UPI001357F12F|nr:NAD(P)+ transhydrogenase beta chain [Rhizobium sp. 18055]
MQKPSYRTSKQQLWLTSGLAWVLIYMLGIGAVLQGEAVAFATIAIPSLVFLVGGSLGIHRHYGSKDMEIMSQNGELN